MKYSALSKYDQPDIQTSSVSTKILVFDLQLKSWVRPTTWMPVEAETRMRLWLVNKEPRCLRHVHKHQSELTAKTGRGLRRVVSAVFFSPRDGTALLMFYCLCNQQNLNLNSQRINWSFNINLSSVWFQDHSCTNIWFICIEFLRICSYGCVFC